MRENSIVSWTVSSQSASVKGGSLVNPSWREVEEKLLLSLKDAGTVTLDIEDQNGHPRSLQVRAEGGMFVITLGVEAKNDWVVRTYQNPIAKSENILILGDVWNARIVCDDKALVVAAFDEFYNTGDVSEKYLPY
ncbi:DUF6911 family protein [Collimonas arenae]|uniref:DUF6911 family protein n=1 Tax=Collimonas arenae TaxID=279058 RepID=UPI0007782575|nr:hypothetical protein [Collimonas arenae]